MRQFNEQAFKSKPRLREDHGWGRTGHDPSAPAPPPSTIALLLGVSLLAGCTQFPELDRTITPALEAAPPDLVPIDPLAKATAGRIDPARTEAALTGRTANLGPRGASAAQAPNPPVPRGWRGSGRVLPARPPSRRGQRKR